MKERVSFHHGIAIWSAAPKKFKFQLILIKYDPIIGGVGEDEFLFLQPSGEVVLGSEEKEGCSRQGDKTVVWAEFVPRSSLDVMDYRWTILGDLHRQGSLNLD